MSAPSPKVRPTARRLRELLFDQLGVLVEDARFLDLCAGSGAVGIEALSRGALHVTFVDRSQKACGFIAANLLTCASVKTRPRFRRAIVCRFYAAPLMPAYGI